MFPSENKKVDAALADFFCGWDKYEECRVTELRRYSPAFPGLPEPDGMIAGDSEGRLEPQGAKLQGIRLFPRLSHSIFELFLLFIIICYF